VDNNEAMPTWSEIEQDAPDFALRVRVCFDAGTNKTLATLRRDGAPRISASETEFSADGEITVGVDEASRRASRPASSTPQPDPGTAKR
jgi:hypothetical protein